MPAHLPASPASFRLPWAALLIVLAGLVSYHNSLSGPFVFDDHLSIAENPTLQSLGTAWSPPRGQGATVEGRPLLNLSLALSRSFSRHGTAGFHALNLVIHLGAALALFGLVRRTLVRPLLNERLRAAATPLALTVALLWMVHPLQTESVTYIVQRAESQMGLFFLLSLYAFVRGSEDGPWRRSWLSAAVVSCWLGAATKEVTVAAPVLALLYDRAFIAGGFRAAWRARRGVYLGLFSAWFLVAWLVWSSGSRGGTVGFQAQVGWWDYALTQCDAITRYLGLALWPHPLVFDYGVEAKASLLAVAPQALLVAALVGGTVVALIRRPAWGFLGFWFFALLAPTSLIPGNRQTIAEHRLYLSLAAVLVVIVVLLYRWLDRRSHHPLFVAAWVVGLIGLTLHRNEDYRTELRLYQDTVAKRPGNAFAHYNLAKLLAEQGDTRAALPEYEAALRVRPDFPAAHFNLGNAFVELGRLPEAEEAFRAALRLQPAYAQAHYNLGNVLIQLGRKVEAATHFAAAVKSTPDFHLARENLGAVLLELGRLDAARTEFEATLRQRPDSAAAHFGLGNVWFLTGRMAEALAEYERTLQLAPDFTPAQQQQQAARAALAPRF